MTHNGAEIARIRVMSPHGLMLLDVFCARLMNESKPCDWAKANFNHALQTFDAIKALNPGPNLGIYLEVMCNDSAGYRRAKRSDLEFA